MRAQQAAGANAGEVRVGRVAVAVRFDVAKQCAVLRVVFHDDGRAGLTFWWSTATCTWHRCRSRFRASWASPSSSSSLGVLAGLLLLSVLVSLGLSLGGSAS